MEMASGGFRKRWRGENTRDKGCSDSDEGRELGHIDGWIVGWERVGIRVVMLRMSDEIWYC